MRATHSRNGHHWTGAVALAAAAATAGLWSASAPADTTVTFQNGVNGYSGTVDRSISTASANGSVSTSHYNIDGYGASNASPDSPMLLRFDDVFGNGAGQVPMGAYILNAQLQMNTYSSTTANTPGPIGIAGLLQPFTSSTAYSTYDISGGVDVAGTGGNRGPWYENGQTVRPIAGFGTVAINQVVSGNVTPLVQGWSNGSVPLNGMAIQTGFTGTTDAWSVYSSGTATPAQHPKLTISYTTDPITVSTFQNGANGYNGTTMALVQHDPVQGNLTTDGSGIAEEFIDHGDPTTSADSAAAIKFGNLFVSGGGSIPDNAVIRKATLVITSADDVFSTNTRSPGPWEVDQLGKAWDLNTDYATFGAGGPGTDPSDVKDDAESGMITDSQVSFDVTSSLKAFESGTANNGWAIRGDTTDGWGINFTGSNQDTIPQLLVAWSPFAGIFAWNLPGAGNWSASGSWTGGGVPQLAGADVTFGSAAAADTTVNVDMSASAGSITFDNASHSYTLSGTGTITLDALGSSAAINVVNGSHAIAAPVALADDTTVTVTPPSSVLTVSNLQPSTVAITKAGAGTLVVNNVRAGALTIGAGTVQILSDGTAAGVSSLPNLSIAAGAKLDLTNNKLVITTAGATGTWDAGTSAYTGVSGMVQSARNGGSWNGSGITSSLASTGGSNLYALGVAKVGDIKQIADSDTTSFAGQTVHGSDTIVMYTYGGDANLDGKINIDDYGRIDGNVGQSGTVFGWYNGDFNYDGKINIDDYGIIDGNIGLQGAPIDTSDRVAGVMIVPEPASLSLIALAGAGLLKRRRRD